MPVRPGGFLLRRAVVPVLGAAIASFAIFKDSGGPAAHEFGLQQSLLLLAGCVLLFEGLAAQRERAFPALLAAIERGDAFGVALARLLAVTIATTWLFDFRGYLVDDSFISFRFAKHFADGHGFAWNVGEPPVEGFSNLAWTLLAALSIRLGLDPLLVSRVVGAACVYGSILVVHRAARRTGVSPGAAAVAPLALACMPAMGFWAMSGLEPTSVVCLAAWACDALLREAGGTRWPWRTALATVLLALSRPEGPAIVALIAAPTLLAAGRDGLARGLRLALLVAPAIVALAAWRAIVFGDVVPNTVVAKVHWMAGAPLASAFVAYAMPLWLPLFARLARGRASPFECGAAALTAAWVLLTLQVAPQVAHDHRFFLPVLPALLVCAASAWDEAFPVRGEGSRLTRAALAVAVAVTLGLPAFAMKPYAEAEARGLREAHARLADWLRTTLPRGSLVAASDVGLIGYRSGLPVLDLWGLADARIARHGVNAAEVLARRPAAIVLHSLGEREFVGRESYDRVLFAGLAGDPGWVVARRLRFYGYWLWVFRRAGEAAAPGADAAEEPQSRL